MSGLFFTCPQAAAVATDHGVEVDPGLSTERSIVLRGIEHKQRILGGIPAGIESSMLAELLSDLRERLEDASADGEMRGRAKAAGALKEVLGALVDQAVQPGELEKFGGNP